MRLLKGFAWLYSMLGFALWWSVFNNAVLVLEILGASCFLCILTLLLKLLALCTTIYHPDVCMFSYGCLPCFVPLPSNFLSFKYLLRVKYSSAAVQFFEASVVGNIIPNPEHQRSVLLYCPTSEFL